MATEPLVHPTIPQQALAAERPSRYSITQAYRHDAMWAMKLVVIVMAVIVVCTLGWTYKIWRASVGRPPLIVGINDATQAAYILRPESVQMPRLDQPVRSALLHWAEDFLQRSKIGDDRFRKSLFYMQKDFVTNGKLLPQAIKEFEAVRHGEMQEVSIRAVNAVINHIEGRCTERPCSALIQFEKTTPDRPDLPVPAVAEVQFMMTTTVDETAVYSNPLGLVITWFQVSEGR